MAREFECPDNEFNKANSTSFKCSWTKSLICKVVAQCHPVIQQYNKPSRFLPLQKGMKVQILSARGHNIECAVCRGMAFQWRSECYIVHADEATN